MPLLKRRSRFHSRFKRESFAMHSWPWIEQVMCPQLIGHLKHTWKARSVDWNECVIWSSQFSHYLSSTEKDLKIQACTGIWTLTSGMLVQSPTSWAIRPTRSWLLCGSEWYCPSMIGWRSICLMLIHEFHVLELRIGMNVHFIFYIALSHEDWELQNSQIWLAKIDIDRGLDFPI